MRALSPIFNLLTVLALAGTCLVAALFAVLLAVPGAVPAFLRQPTEPAQVVAVTPQSLASPTLALAYPTLPPEWTATPSPQPSATEKPVALDTAAPTASPGPSATLAPPASVTPTPTATAVNVVTLKPQANVRSGPSTAYPVALVVKSAQTAPVIGRDGGAHWFAITIDGAPGGTGWVSTLAASYAGDINALPVVQPSGPPPTPAASKTPVAPPTATGVPNIGGIQTLLFNMRKTTGAVGENMWFDFQVKNLTASAINYGILAAHTDQGYTADSWHEPLQPGQVLSWNDHINFGVRGTYLVYLGICYSNHDACKTGGAAWTKLSPTTSVTIN